MKINLTKYTLIGLTLLTLGCSRSSEDYADEDYEKLFPFPGIEKPKVSYEDQIVQLAIPTHQFRTMYIQEWTLPRM